MTGVNQKTSSPSTSQIGEKDVRGLRTPETLRRESTKEFEFDNLGTHNHIGRLKDYTPEMRLTK